MDEPLKKIESSNNVVWVSQPRDDEDLLKRREIAFDVAMGKLVDHGSIETVMQTAEAFGRGLHSDFIKNQCSDDVTLDQWIKPVVKNIFNPLGTGATFTEITEDSVKSIVFSCPHHENVKRPNMASLFTYGFLRGVLLSSFPNGELLMNSTTTKGAPNTKFTFKANADDMDRLERERVKSDFVDDVG